MSKFFRLRVAAVAAVLSGMSALALAQGVQVEQAWTRATVAGQQGGGAFMVLTAQEDARLVGAASPVAGITEIHEMVMEGDVMRMRAVEAIELPAGEAVALKPGGLHVMFMELKQQLSEGSTVPLSLQFRDAQGAESTLELDLEVRPIAHRADADHDHDHDHH